MFRKIARNSLAIIIAFLISSFSAFAAPDGKALFSSKCASCHNPLKDATGPALKNVDKSFPTKDWVYNWVHNPPAVLASGDKLANDLKAKFGSVMTAFPDLGKDEIDAILKYVDAYEAPVAATPTGGNGAEQPESNGWVYTLITLALLLLAIILWRANTALRRVANEKSGIPNEKEIPLYRNKVVIALVSIIAFIAAGYWMVNGAVNMGRQQNYQPLQPIFYSHAVHAGINQVNCLYCHAGAEKSRQAMVPSSNVCMNCHKQINGYTGEKEHPLKTAEGKVINGTAEIQKLYAFAGWDTATKSYKMKDGKIDAHPIQWVKIHNLPDHVYFNHSQHVKVGQVQCQRCHGPIQEMDEVYQFSPLSMGWCINCHRQTEVKFTENNYYQIFEKYHQEMKNGTRTKVTVADIGGLECQRCHY